MKRALAARLTARRPRTTEGPKRPRQAVASSAQPLVVVSTTQEDDWDESSSFLMEPLLQVLSLSGTDFMSRVCFVSRAGCFLGTWGGSTVQRLPLGCECSSGLLGMLGASPEGDGNSSSFLPSKLSRAGLMRGLRWRREPELEATEPATEGAGEGTGEEGQLPESREK